MPSVGPTHRPRRRGALVVGAALVASTLALGACDAITGPTAGPGPAVPDVVVTDPAPTGPQVTGSDATEGTGGTATDGTQPGGAGPDGTGSTDASSAPGPTTDATTGPGTPTDAATPTPAPTGSAGPTAPATPTPPPTAPAAPTTPKPTHKPEPAEHANLVRGDHGPRVKALQQDLKALGYWITGTDGTFGPSTQQAVWAVQKAAGLPRDGVVGARTLAAIEAGTRPAARTTSGHVIEVDLTKQLVLLVDDGTVSTVLNASSGSGKPFTDKNGHHYVATTPTGDFRMGRQYDGNYTSNLGLGQMWRPKFFNGGIALHGLGYDVPPYPASHGCVRVSNPAMDWIWSTGKAPQGTRVLVYRS